MSPHVFVWRLVYIEIKADYLVYNKLTSDVNKHVIPFRINGMKKNTQPRGWNNVIGKGC